MNKRGNLWNAIKDPVCGTRDHNRGVRDAWAEAQDIDDFAMMLESELFARVAATVVPDNQAVVFATACRNAVTDIIAKYGTPELRESVAKANALLDDWDGKRRITIEDRSELEHVCSLLVQNVEFAHALDEVRNFPAVFDSLFRMIGESRAEAAHPILCRHLKTFIVDTLEAVAS